MGKKSRNRNYQLIQDYLQFVTKNNKRESILHQMKYLLDVGELRKIQSVVRTLIPTIDIDIEGRLFPSDFTELCTTLVPFHTGHLRGPQPQRLRQPGRVQRRAGGHREGRPVQRRLQLGLGTK